jgi:hypothetical protein
LQVTKPVAGQQQLEPPQPGRPQFGREALGVRAVTDGTMLEGTRVRDQ